MKIVGNTEFGKKIYYPYTQTHKCIQLLCPHTHTHTHTHTHIYIYIYIYILVWDIAK